MYSSVVFSEDDLLPISALADLCFCERRAALHRIEGIWEDNVATVEGSYLHKKVDLKPSSEVRREVLVTRSLIIRSLRLGLLGKTDVVEFYPLDHNFFSDFRPGARMGKSDFKSLVEKCLVFPVEYKRGKLRREMSFEVQLCAQAICLEEMLDIEVPAGAIFYGKTGRRMEIAFNDDLRKRTEEAARRLHEILRSGITPTAQYEKKCDKCSLISTCIPKTTGTKKSVRSYLEKALE